MIYVYRKRKCPSLTWDGKRNKFIYAKKSKIKESDLPDMNGHLDILLGCWCDGIFRIHDVAAQVHPKFRQRHLKRIEAKLPDGCEIIYATECADEEGLRSIEKRGKTAILPMDSSL